MRKWRIVGLSFEHAHMGDLLREVYEHPERGDRRGVR